MKLLANAKLNLTLEVGGRRADGYHNIDTVMHSISLCDVVTLGASASVEVTCAGLDCDAQDNIAYKAARAFLHERACPAACGSIFPKAFPSARGWEAAALMRPPCFAD